MRAQDQSPVTLSPYHPITLRVGADAAQAEGGDEVGVLAGGDGGDGAVGGFEEEGGGEDGGEGCFSDPYDEYGYGSFAADYEPP